MRGTDRGRAGDACDFAEGLTRQRAKGEGLRESGLPPHSAERLAFPETFSLFCPKAEPQENLEKGLSRKPEAFRTVRRQAATHTVLVG
ncbi:MAG: hypothetical protein QOD75_3493 [Blastocatellia bacterium]|nr:hypothetical protein [Blastocatellia bacterium]